MVGKENSSESFNNPNVKSGLRIACKCSFVDIYRVVLFVGRRKKKANTKKKKHMRSFWVLSQGDRKRQIKIK